MTSYFAAQAQLPEGLTANVRLAIDEGRFTGIASEAQPHRDDRLLPGIVLPGFANTHSHAFHRALRGRTHDSRTHDSRTRETGGTFWTWRDAMYLLASRLTPDNYHRLATAVFAEMVLAGVTSVGEFHYVHHQPDGTPYPDPNAMGAALISAARAAGLRITLLDTCYLSGGLTNGRNLLLTPAQQRFGDGDAAGWARRVAALHDGPGVRIGAAIHSVRAVPADQLATIVAAAAGRPLHVHLSEQPAENEQCLAAYGVTPTMLLDRCGALTPLTTAVHGTHLTSADIALLARSGSAVSFCPTTERDLADGIGPAGALADAGVPLTLGTDQNAVIDLFEEARAVELHERLSTGRRGRFSPADLAVMLTAHSTLGWPDAGRIEVGARADLVEVDQCSVRTAGADPGQLVFAASAADIRTVVIDGEQVVTKGRHRLGDIGAMLAGAITEVTE